MVNLMIVKLYVNGLKMGSLRFPFDYLSCRKQTNKMRSAYSNWSEDFCGISWGSIRPTTISLNCSQQRKRALGTNGLFIRTNINK